MRKFLGVATMALAGALCANAAHAQSADTAANTAADAGASANGGIQDIVVTAQRRSENLQKAALAVSAVSGDVLAEAGVTRPTELTAIVPSLQVSSLGGPFTLFYLRGVGNITANAFSESAIAFNMDGVYVGRPTSTSGYFYDLARVEVVKGPQGTLYGRNATGGAINVISHKPDLNTRSMKGSVDFGNYDSVRVEGAVNVPLGSDAAIRVAGMRAVHDGYMNDGTDDQNDWGLRGALRYEPTSDLKILISGDYSHTGGSGAGSTPLFSFDGNALPFTLDVKDRVGLLSPQGQAVFTSSPNFLLGRPFSAIPGNLPQYANNRFWSVNAQMDWTSAAGTLTLIPSHREGKLDYRSYAFGFFGRQLEKSKQDSVEARFATPEDKPLRALLGAYYYKEHTQDPTAIYLHQSNGSYQHDIDLNTKSTALFGRLTYEVVPDVKLTVGARQTWETKTFTGNLNVLNRICTAAACPTAPGLPYDETAPALGTFPSVLVPALGPSPYGGLPDVLTAPDVIQTSTQITADRRAKFNKFTWRVGGEWNVTPQNMVYASYETGFKAGGFFFSNDAGVYRPETIQAFTVGSKNRFLDNRVQLNLELFYWKYKDQQTGHLTQDSAGAVILATENVGKANYKGVEAELVLAPTHTTTLNADLQYLDAKYDSFVYTTPNLNGGIGNGTGCANGAAPGVVYTVDCSGKRPAFAPEWTINLGAEQRIPVSFGEFSANVRGHYQSASLASTDYLPIEYQKAYWLVDASLSFTDPDKHFTISGYVNNLFDETVKGQVLKNPFGPLFAATLRPPRTYGVRLGFDF